MHSVEARDLMGKAEIVVNKQGVISQLIRDNKVQKCSAIERVKTNEADKHITKNNNHENTRLKTNGGEVTDNK